MFNRSNSKKSFKIGLFLARGGKTSTGDQVITPRIATIVKTLWLHAECMTVQENLQ